MAGKGISLSGSGVVKAFDHGGIWCRRCLDDLGEKRKAHRVMPKSGGRCEEHYREEAGISQRTPEAQAFIDRWKIIKDGHDFHDQVENAPEEENLAAAEEQSEPDEAA